MIKRSGAEEGELRAGIRENCKWDCRTAHRVDCCSTEIDAAGKELENWIRKTRKEEEDVV